MTSAAGAGNCCQLTTAAALLLELNWLRGEVAAAVEVCATTTTKSSFPMYFSDLLISIGAKLAMSRLSEKKDRKRE